MALIFSTFLWSPEPLLQYPCVRAPTHRHAWRLVSLPPHVGLAPKCRLEGPPPPLPCALGLRTPPLHKPGPPCPGALQKEPREVGGEREGEGGEGMAVQYNAGMGGTAKGQLRPDPHLGAFDGLTWGTTATRNQPKEDEIGMNFFYCRDQNFCGSRNLFPGIHFRKITDLLRDRPGLA